MYRYLTSTVEEPMFFDPLYFVFLIPGLLIGGWASIRVKRVFARFAKQPSETGMSGADVARELLRQNGIADVQVERHSGWFTDHYHPGARVIRLSPDVYDGRSVTAVGVAAHETGHAIQHARGYAPLHVRQQLVVPANIGSSASFIVIILGLLLGMAGLITLGVVLFALVVVFQLVTLPVEFNASARAKQQLAATGISSPGEQRQVAQVLNAAAWTYVAALITSVLTLAYYLIRFTGDD
jgi:uncharacterized protein